MKHRRTFFGLVGRVAVSKTIAAKLLLARTILLAPPELQPVELVVIDPKADKDFSFLESIGGFFRGEESPRGLDYVFELFKQRQQESYENKNQHLVVAFVDEFASLVNLIECKKEKEAAHRKLSLLLMLARSFKFSIQTATQQPSAQTLGNSGVREQYGNICLLSDVGAETQHMLFDSDSRERIKEFGKIGGRAVGWISMNGGIAQPVRVPIVSNMEKLNAVIKNNMIGIDSTIC
jgi:hypothetical protein